MTFAFWMILAGALLPIITTGIAKWGAPGFNNASPRDWQENLKGFRRRADWAHRNHFEAFPMFAAAVLVATLAHAPQTQINWLAGAWVIFRILYTACYLANLPTPRSLVWTLAFACVVGLFVIGV
jgi:uncharacterized MAPEG superfamily protein